MSLGETLKAAKQSSQSSEFQGEEVPQRSRGQEDKWLQIHPGCNPSCKGVTAQEQVHPKLRLSNTGGPCGRKKHHSTETLSWPVELRTDHSNVREHHPTSLEREELVCTAARHDPHRTNVERESQSGPRCDRNMRSCDPHPPPCHPKLDECLQQIPGATSEVSVQKSAVLETVKKL